MRGAMSPTLRATKNLEPEWNFRPEAYRITRQAQMPNFLSYEPLAAPSNPAVIPV
jgi:hypothetical protein